MFIKKITIENFRLFKSEETFEIDNLNIPDNNNGSGLNLFVGENGCGKTSLLEAFALPLLSYKADGFSLSDFFDPREKTNIQIFSKQDFDFDGTMPNAKYKGKGFSFEAGIRVRDNKSYLSSIVVSDQKYLKADNQGKPKDNSPDLRVSVNNPFKGSRFNENDILFLDKNRTYQIRLGTYNPTRFDRLMEDFDFQYLKQKNNPFDCNEKLKEISNNIENKFLKNAINKFQEISGENISLAYINNWTPHKKAFFGIEKENKQHITLNSLGSGYEMIFSLLYSFYLSQQNNKQLIVFIDEPELHLHPKLQEDFVKILLEFSKTAQIILTTHSPLFVKQVLYNEKVQVNVLKTEVKIAKIEDRVLSYLSANEINFIAFGLPTEEYHNELYEELKIRDDNSRTTPLNLKDFDLNFFQNTKQEPSSYPYNGTANQVSIHTHLRTQIHHRGTAGQADVAQIKQSIEKMRKFLI
ncbi:ATP-binding protein [Patescibacteria group bacterium]|nr:ATP-binding protein [Patescibacteria group bacterium]MCG2699437.1 ATP-binding protein [Candidatus Parcubacteria bacterium]